MLSLIEKADLDLKNPANIFSTLTDETQVKELKVLSALATVLVKEHENVAVVAKRDNDLELSNFIVTINPPKDAAPDGPQTYPTILETMWSDHRKEPMLPVLHLMTYYRKRSKLLFVHSDFVHHAGMVKVFLQYHTANFLSYVVGACYCKMCRRPWDPLSIPYFQFIQDIVLSPSTFPHH